MKKMLISLTCLCLMNVQAQALKIYLLSNHDNVGDHNQTLGIRAAFEKFSQEKNTEEDLNTKTVTALEIKRRVEKDLAHEKVVVIGAGEGGIDGVVELPKHPNLITCLTSHMLLDRYKNQEVLEKVDFIALPTHVASSVKKEWGPKLIETTGVAHNRCLNMAIYEEWKTDLPHSNVYLGAYLGGDAPTPTKEMKLFTEEDASRLADYVIAKAKDTPGTCVLVLNGPRTGKFDEEKKENLTAHRAGKADPITDSFGRKLAESGLKYKVFDFQYNTPENKQWVSPFNAVDLVTAAVKATNGTMLVPGESTSVISEVIDTLPKDHVIVYKNSAMNEIHEAHVASERISGRAHVLEEYKEIQLPAVHEGEFTPGAAHVIAKALSQAVSKP